MHIAVTVIFYIGVCINAILLTEAVPQRSYDKWFTYLGILLITHTVVEFAYVPLKEKYATINFSKISTSSMSPALNSNDHFVWKKTKDIKKGDVAVFNFPGEENTLYVFRNVSSPGDELEIKNSRVYLNGIKTENIKTKSRYRIHDNNKINPNVLSEIGIDEIFSGPGSGLIAHLTQNQIDKLSTFSKVEPMYENKGVYREFIFPYSPILRWNSDHFGPIIIPKKGQTIDLHGLNATIYGTIIHMCENVGTVEFNEHGQILINGKIVHSYEFKQDYYFMMGDNRHNAADSRFRGLIPSHHIKGKALYKWWSDDSNQIGIKLN